MNNLFLLTGGNMGNRVQYLQVAVEMIANSVGAIVQQSKIYETSAWGFTDQQSFLNQVLQVSTQLTPGEVLQTILAIEKQLGRERLFKLGPRVIDIDILLYNQVILTTTDLQVPHKELHNRRFVLVPLNEIASNFIHPVFKKSIQELLVDCTDDLEVMIHHSNS